MAGWLVFELCVCDGLGSVCELCVECCCLCFELCAAGVAIVLGLRGSLFGVVVVMSVIGRRLLV